VETFWNSHGHGLRPWCCGQFQLSFSLKPHWVPAPPVKSAVGPYLPILMQNKSAASAIFEQNRPALL
jgi:hypothetical protein